MWVQYPQGVQKRYLQNDRSTEHSGHVLQLTDLHALLLNEEYLAHLWQHTSPESLLRYLPFHLICLNSETAIQAGTVNKQIQK